MKNFLFKIVIGLVLLQARGAAAGELPTFEVAGLPISAHQVAVLGPANVEEQSRTATLTFRGMPASPHQVAVLTPRPKASETFSANLAAAGYP